MGGLGLVINYFPELIDSSPRSQSLLILVSVVGGAEEGFIEILRHLSGQFVTTVD